MVEQEEEELDERLEGAMRAHLKKWVGRYEALPDETKAIWGLLEYRVTPNDPKSNHFIDRDLLVDYLSLKVAKSNNRLQKIVGAFVLITAISAAIQAYQILKNLGLIP